MVQTHQPGQAVFRAILPEDIDWQPFPAFPPAARLAIVVGSTSEPAPYVIRVKVPAGVKLMPQRHPEDRIYTVISGVFYVGLGDRFDASKVEAYPPGTVVILPGNTPHFHWAKSGEYVTQVTAIGPLGLEYLDPRDDPREQERQSVRSETAFDPVSLHTSPDHRDRTMSMRPASTRSIALIVLAVVVLLAAVQFGPAVLSGLSSN